MLYVPAKDIPELKSWLAHQENKWLSHDILNEMIEMMAHDFLRKLIREVQSAGVFAVIMNETTDISVKEQVYVCYCYVTENLEPEERFL